jgi:uncharacterized repeat protein (TIGR01451 family)
MNLTKSSVACASVRLNVAALHGGSRRAALARLAVLGGFLVLSLLAPSRASAQVDVTATAGTLNASYTTLKGAFDAINLGTHQGTITIGISGNTTEAAPAVLNASGSGGASYATIGISPTGGAARTISGAIAAGSPLIDMNGADNVTFDGLNTGGNSLTIANTTASATSGTATFRFIGGATNNTITNSNVQGSNSASVATNGAIIFFSTDAVTANGNDNNTISNNNIGPAGANLPTKAILGNGSTTTTAIGNSGIVINNNNIFDFFGAAVTSAGVATNGGCNTWTITNNRFYQTGTRTWTTGAIHAAINIQPTTATSGAQGFTITGNIIGFASNTQTGTYTLTGSTGSFRGILFNGITGGTVSNINSNTVAAVSLTGVTSSGTGTAAPLLGILAQTGLMNTNSNIIGSQGATGSLTFSTTTATASEIYGIYNFSSDDWTANGNNVGGISVTNLGAAAFTVFGMRANTASAKVFNAASNNVGGTIANSISLTSTGAASQVVGIASPLPIGTLTSNTIRNLTNNNGTGTTTGASLIGISITATTNQTLSQNTIFGLTNTHTTVGTVVTGIQFNGGAANLVARNLIYGLTTASNSTAAEVNGIRVAGGTTTYRNNMIAVGAGIANAIGTGSTAGISGINEPAGTDNFFHNSVYVGGSPTAGVGPSFAFNSTVTTNVRSYRDNVFFNARSNAGATGKNYIVRVGGTAPNPAGLTINNNVYFANGTGAVFGFFNALDVTPNLAAWKAAVGQDASSLEANPQYNDPTNATPDLHIHPTNPTPVESNGADVGVTDDFDGQTRASFTPVDIGADAGNFVAGGPDVGPPFISYTPLGNTTSTSNRTLPSTITDGGSGVPTAGVGLPVIYFRKGTSGAFASTQASFGGGSSYTFTIDYSLVTGGSVAPLDTIQYYVVAQDLAAPPNVGSNPSTGAGGFTANPPAAGTPPTPPNSYVIQPIISGIKTVCASGCDFPTLTGATGIFFGINNGIVTGNVDIQIAGDLVVGEDGSNGLNALNESPPSSNFTVRIYPTGVARAITGSFAGALVRMRGSSRVTIDGSIGGVGTDRSLTITNTSVTTPSVVLIGSVGTTPVTDDTLKNCVVINGANTSSAVVISDATVLGNAGVFSNITIQNNDVQKAFVGVFATGGTTPQGGSNLVYTQNKVDTSGANAIRNVGLYMQGVNGATVTQNTVGNFSAVEGENDTGIWLASGTANGTVSGNTVSNLGMTLTTGFAPFGIRESSGLAVSGNAIDGNTVTNLTTTGGTGLRGIAVQGGGVTVQRNKIQGIINNNTVTFGAFGIDVVSGNDAVIKNNFISDVNHNMTGGAAFGPDFGVIGIRLGAGTGHKVYFNSVNLFGPHTGTATTNLLSAAFSISTTAQTGIDVRDNIFANNITGGTTSIAHVSVFLPSGGTAAMNLTWNNNAYYFGTDAARQGVGQAGTAPGVNFFTTLPALAAYTSTLSGAGTNDNASFASTAAVPFTTSTDLHLTASTPVAVAAGGVPIAGITTDIDNDTRSLTAPSMGADELQADLSITKNDGVGTATPGGSTTYTITASNAGPGGTTGTVTDNFVAALTCTWTCVGAGGGTCTAAGAGNISDPVVLPAGGSVTYTASCTISAAATGSLVNTATVAGVAGDPVPGNNSQTDTDTLVPSADLSMTKTDGTATYTPGGSTTYTITASNTAGPSNTTATVTDNFPGVLTCSWTCVGANGGTCTAAGAGNISDPVTLPVTGSVTYTAICTISPAATGNLDNTASVSGAAGDPNGGNNSQQDSDTPTFVADLSITKTDGTTTYTAGGSTTYTITASNTAGPSNTTGTVTDNFPGVLTCSWTCVGAGGGLCTAAGAGNISDPVTLPAGGSVTYTASCTISPAATGNLDNTASVAGAASDPNGGNNSQLDSDTPAPSADLSITKTDGTTTYTPGTSTTYTITASNTAGPSNTTGTVTDNFPGTLTCSWTCVGAGGGLCTAAGAGNISDPVTLPVGGSVTYTASCTISAAATGNLDNTASVAGAASDPNGGNNSQQDSDTLAASSDIAITKSVNNSSPGISTNVIFTISATNNGPSNATGVKVNDLLPAGLAYVSDVPSVGSYASATGIWTIGSLANGATATLQLTATVNRLESQVNQATSSGQGQADPKGSNNTATVRLNGAPLIDIQVTETVNNSTPGVSQNVIFLVTAKNAGPATANGVVLTSNLPSGITYVSDTPSQGSYTSGTGTWNVGTLAANASATLSLTMTNNVATPVTQTFTKTASTEQDLVAGNDAASVTLNPAGTQADLALSKIVTQEPVASGVNFNYVVVVTNLGPGTATGVTMTDALPAGVSLIAAAPSQGSCSGITTVTCPLGTLLPGDSATIDLRVTKTVGGSISNSAAVAGNESDPNSANDSTTTGTTPVTLIDVSVE